MRTRPPPALPAQALPPRPSAPQRLVCGTQFLVLNAKNHHVFSPRAAPALRSPARPPPPRRTAVLSSENRTFLEELYKLRSSIRCKRITYLTCSHVNQVVSGFFCAYSRMASSGDANSGGGGRRCGLVGSGSGGGCFGTLAPARSISAAGRAAAPSAGDKSTRPLARDRPLVALRLPSGDRLRTVAICSTCLPVSCRSCCACNQTHPSEVSLVSGCGACGLLVYVYLQAALE